MNGIFVNKGDVEPVPSPGDEIEITNSTFLSPGRYTIIACNCWGGGEKFWPQGSKCGAHLLDKDGLNAHHICYSGGGYWNDSGTLYRKGVIVMGFVSEPRNNDGRTECFWCKISTEKRGGGMYDVCPKCGR